MARKSKIKKCVILNPPTTPEEQQNLERRVAKAIARALYKSLSHDEYKCVVNHLRHQVRGLG